MNGPAVLPFGTLPCAVHRTGDRVVLPKIPLPLWDAGPYLYAMSEEKPNYRKQILCLANSRRPGGRCVAGKELAGDKIGHWVRPVNARNNDAITESDLQDKDGSSSDVLDIVSVPFIQAMPTGHQQENHNINPNFYWLRQGRATWDQIVAATDNVQGPLWVNGDHSYHGMNDKVSQQLASQLKSSLFLIEPKKLSLIVAEESQYGGGSRRRVRAALKFDGVDYNFVVTDPWIETKYFAGKDGTYPISVCRVCVSLAEVVGDSATKLVASVITPDRVV
jgi:hypothetical protein